MPVAAIEHAAVLGVAQAGQMLSINFLPNAVYEPAACIRLTLATAKRTGFPLRNLIFEFTENEEVDPAHVAKSVASYRGMGFKTAIDDFGAGFSGLTLLARFQPDIVKLDMELVRGIDRDPVRRAIVRNIAKTCEEIGVTILGEGVETEGEYETLKELGVNLQQGYVFARPQLASLAEVRWPEATENCVVAAA